MPYGCKRLLILLLTLFFVSVITFTAFSVLPGDAGRVVLGVNASQEQVDAYNAKLGLDKPVIQRYFSWIGNALTGNLGESYIYNKPVSSLIGSRLPATMMLTLLSLVIVLVVSIPLGFYSAKRKNKPVDTAIMVTGQVTMAIPNFFLGILLSWIFGVILLWFKPGQYVSYDKNFWGFLQYLILPAVAIALPKIGMTVKFLRASVIEQLQAGYTRTAKGIGTPPKQIMYQHILRNAFLPVVTFLGILTADVIGGSVIIEQVFQIPGIGRLLYDSIANRDLPLAQGLVLYIAVMVLVINFVVDLIYKALDPRVTV